MPETRFEVAHLMAGARGRNRLVIDDRDRLDLLARVADALRASMLAYCVMDTHLHVVAEGPSEHTARWLLAALTAYVRAFNRRHGLDGALLRGPVEAIEVPGPDELGRTIRYDHENPARTRVPIVDHPIEYPWSSARAFAGLAARSPACIARAHALLGAAGRALATPCALAGLEPHEVPAAGPSTILAAAAQAFGVPVDALCGPDRSPVVGEARAVFVRLGEIESYRHGQLARVLCRTRVRVTQLAAAAAGLDREVRVARTLATEPRFRRWLPAVASPPEHADLPQR